MLGCHDHPHSQRTFQSLEVAVACGLGRERSEGFVRDEGHGARLTTEITELTEKHSSRRSRRARWLSPQPTTAIL